MPFDPRPNALSIRTDKNWNGEVKAGRARHGEFAGLSTDAETGGSLDFTPVTANVTLDWPVIINALAPKERLHMVGAVLGPIPMPTYSLITGHRAISGSPLGSPATTAKMLAFCARLNIAPLIEKHPLSRVNEALEHLRAGHARYRIVPENDLG